MNQNEVMIIAAEASSAHYALKLIQHFKSLKKNIHFFGVGSDAMESEGFERIGKAEEMAVVGVSEIVSHYSEIKKVFHQLVSLAEKRRPKVVVLMDYPEFNLMLAKKLKAMGIKCFYYISPQVWAWRKGRINKIREYCEKVFLLFPFEIDFYKKHQVPFEFVGHPLLEDLNPDFYDKSKIDHYRQRYGIKPQEKVLALMPGSRRSELDQNLDTQLEVARILLKKYSDLKIVFFVAPSIKKEAFAERLENFRSPYILLQDDPFKMISAADYVLVASGTATLMVGLLEKPMVIMYKIKPFTYFLAKLLVHGVKFFGLVNLILEKEAVPERLQGQANPQHLADLIQRYIENKEHTENVVKDLRSLRTRLGDVGATIRVADALLPFIEAP